MAASVCGVLYSNQFSSICSECGVLSVRSNAANTAHATRSIDGYSPQLSACLFVSDKTIFLPVLNKCNQLEWLYLPVIVSCAAVSVRHNVPMLGCIRNSSARPRALGLGFMG